MRDCVFRQHFLTTQHGIMINFLYHFEKKKRETFSRKKKLKLFLFQMQHSTGYVLFMHDAKFINSGAYTCEVIVDTTFDTLMFTKKMMVIGKCISQWGNHENLLSLFLCLFLFSKNYVKSNGYLVIGILHDGEVTYRTCYVHFFKWE